MPTCGEGCKIKELEEVGCGVWCAGDDLPTPSPSPFLEKAGCRTYQVYGTEAVLPNGLVKLACQVSGLVAAASLVCVFSD